MFHFIRFRDFTDSSEPGKIQNVTSSLESFFRNCNEISRLSSAPDQSCTT
jgi:hypothetical protein